MHRIDQASWDRLFARTAATGRPLQARLREMVVTAIGEGWLSADMPLPSSRELARNLGVARNTVLLAYQQLVDEEVLEARERSGYFVRPNDGTSLPSGPAVPGRRSLTGGWQARFCMPASWLNFLPIRLWAV